MNRFILDVRTVNPHFPGIGRYVANLAPCIATYLAPDEDLSRSANVPEQAANVHAIAHHIVPTILVKATPLSFAQQWQVPHALRQVAVKGPNLVYHSPYYLMPYWTGYPTVLTFHDLIPLLFPDYVSSRARLLFRWTLGQALRTARAIIAVSKAAKLDAVAHLNVPAAKIKVIPHAADPQFVPQPQTEIMRIRESFDFRAGYLLYVGSNKPHKNLVRMVEAYSTLNKSSPPLVIAGAWDSRYQESALFVQQLRLANRVRFLGPIADADLPGLYAGALAFIFPSLYEGFGLPVLEAMACGTPVACSNASSLPEVAGEAALFFDPYDSVAIADALARLVDDSSLRNKLHEKGLARAKQFSWERTAAATLAVYRRLANAAV